MQRLEVSGAVRPIYGSLGVKRLSLFIAKGGYVCCRYSIYVICELEFVDELSRR